MAPGGTSIASKRVRAPEDLEECDTGIITRKRSRDVTITPVAAPVQDRVAALVQDPTTSHVSSLPVEEGSLDDNETRGVSMGRELDKLTRGVKMKIPIKITKGLKRPEAPMQAAKLASEAGIVLRQTVPVLPHWKAYKNSPRELKNFVGKIADNFDMDTNCPDVGAVCADLLKGGIWNRRHVLKRDFFDGKQPHEIPTASPVPTTSDAQWRDLVVKWSDPKHQANCLKNKQNRAKVQFQQCTGSRSYIAHRTTLHEDKYKNVEPTAEDYFKDFHLSKKHGYSEKVQEAIVEIQTKLVAPVEDGEELKSPTAVVAEVLKLKVPTSKFLQNVGLEQATNKASRVASASRVQDLESELRMEKEGSSGFRQLIGSQQEELAAVKKKSQDSEEEIRLMKKNSDEEMERVKKMTNDTNALVMSMLSKSQVNSTS